MNTTDYNAIMAAIDRATLAAPTLDREQTRQLADAAQRLLIAMHR